MPKTTKTEAQKKMDAARERLAEATELLLEAFDFFADIESQEGLPGDEGHAEEMARVNEYVSSADRDSRKVEKMVADWFGEPTHNVFREPKDRADWGTLQKEYATMLGR